MATTLILFIRFGIAMVLPLLALVVTIHFSHQLRITTRRIRAKFFGAIALMISIAIIFAATAPYPELPGNVAVLLMMWSGTWIALSIAVPLISLEHLEPVNYDEREFYPERY